MTIQIIADGSDEITFEVKGKISLSLTRTGIIYRNELVKDGGEALRLMTEFLGLAESELNDQVHEQVVTHAPKETLAAIRDQKQALLIIQSSDSGEDDSRWTNLYQADIPDWVKEAEVISDLMTGVKVKADGGGVWYRACHVREESIVKH